MRSLSSPDGSYEKIRLGKFFLWILYLGEQENRENGGPNMEHGDRQALLLHSAS
jgi:hypothetical protein